ncbi:HAD family hydrolase [soil metagenome]
MKNSAIIFDLDGTLIDTAPDLWRATNHVLAHAGRRELTLGEVRAFVGHGARSLITRGFAATGAPLDPANLENFYGRFVDHYGDNIAENSLPFPGCIALLDKLKAEGALLGICTNKLEGLSVKLVEALGLKAYFGAVVGPDSIGIAKPDAAPYRETLRRMGAGSRTSVMIGDSETDVLTARAAGVKVIAVTFGYTPRPVAEFGPDFLLEHFDNGYDAIKKVLGC